MVAKIPEDPEELKKCLKDPVWRICSGALYKIMIKGDDGEAATVLPFRPNRAQRRFIKRMWWRNIILKARQLGFTTLIAIMWLDHALFNNDQRCGIIAHTRDDAEVIFRDKVKFAYDNLPEAIKKMVPLKRTNMSEMLFANNSSIRVSVSLRSGTTHRLLVSEFGKICAISKQRAREVMTGSLPSVPKNGIAVIESTAEGREGAYYNMCQIAQKRYEAKEKLSVKDFRFTFSAWWSNPRYSLDENGLLTAADLKYFDELLVKKGITLTEGQMNWYAAELRSTFSGDRQMMMQEYPSTPEEAFSVSMEGKYYTTELADAMRGGRILDGLPIDPRVPVNTFWDLGLSDSMSIWLHQRVGLQDRFHAYFEDDGEPLTYYVQKLQDWRASKYGVVWGKHYLPHDGAKRNPGAQELQTYADMLAELGFRDIEIVPRIDDVTRGIQMTRNAFPSAWFNKTDCAVGLNHLSLYGKVWNARTGTWSSRPLHDIHSNAADAFRQWAQGYKGDAEYQPVVRKNDNWRTV